MGEGDFGETERVVQPDVTDPLDLDSYLPGASGPFSLPSNTPSMDEINSGVDESVAVAEEMTGKILSALADEYIGTMQEFEAIVAPIYGGIDNELDAIYATVDKMAGKLIAGVNNLLYDVFGKLADIGIPLPTQEQIQYGLATGDYLGSVTLPQNDPRPDIPIGDTLVGGGSWRPSSDGGYLPPQPPLPPDPDFPPVLPPPGFPFPCDEATGLCGPNPPANCRPAGDWTPDANGIIWPDCDGKCPPGMRPNGGTGTFDNRCVLDPHGGGNNPPMPQPPGNSRCPPIQTANIAMSYDQTGGIICDDLNRCHCYPWICQSREEQPIEVRRVTLVGNPAIGVDGDIVICFPAGFGLYIMADGSLISANYVGSNASEYPAECLRDVTGGNDPNDPPGGNTGSCPVPEKLTCGPEFKPEFPQMTMDAENICKMLVELVSQSDATGLNFAKLIGMGSNQKESTGIVGDFINAIVGTKGPMIPNLINRFASWVEAINQKIVEKWDCNNKQVGPLAIVQGALRFFNQYLCIVPQPYLTTMTQAVNMACQANLPTCSDANKAYLMDTIDKEIWKCWTKANGNHVKEAEQVMKAGRTKPDPLQLASLFRKKVLTKEQFEKGTREDGVIGDDDHNRFLELTKQWPPASDVVRFMTRDVADETNIDWTTVDAIFDQKFTGPMLDYAEALGYSRELMRDYWRAHFQYPSFTELSYMVHRLRPDAVPDDIATTSDKAENLLIANDFHPDWVKRMMAISYRVPTREDITKEYMLGLIDKASVVKGHLDVGYTQQDAESFGEYWEKKKALNDVKKAGFPSLSTVTNKYGRCLIDEGERQFLVGKVAENDVQADEATLAADFARRMFLKEQVIKMVGWEYRRGLIDDGQAAQQLSNEGIDPECVPALIVRFQRERRIKSKYLSASQLCSMRENQIIDAGEHVNALIRSGWGPLEANRIAAECNARLTEKARKKADAQAKALVRELEKQRKAEAKRLRELECGPVPCPKNRQMSNGVPAENQ